MTAEDELSPLQRRMQLGPRVDQSPTPAVEKETTPPKAPPRYILKKSESNLKRKNFVLPADIMEDFTSRIDKVYHKSRGRYMKRDIAAAIIKAGNDVADDTTIYELLSDICQNDQ